jgi:hypothetical protein
MGRAPDPDGELRHLTSPVRSTSATTSTRERGDGVRRAIEPFDPFDGALGLSLTVGAATTVYLAGSGDAGDIAGSGGRGRQAFANLADTLALAGASLADVVDMATFVAADDEVYPLFQALRSELMAGTLPASATVKVAGFLV